MLSKNLFFGISDEMMTPSSLNRNNERDFFQQTCRLKRSRGDAPPTLNLGAFGTILDHQAGLFV